MREPTDRRMQGSASHSLGPELSPWRASQVTITAELDAQAEPDRARGAIEELEENARLSILLSGRPIRLLTPGPGIAERSGTLEGK
jgi:hypothetical protein